MKGDEEKERAFINSVHRFKRGGGTRLMGGDQAKMEVDDTKEQETVAKNIIASDAGGDDVERFMRTTAKGSATEILSAGEPAFCRRKLPFGECRVIKLGHGCPGAASCLARRGCNLISKLPCAVNPGSKGGLLDICQLFDCALTVHQGSSVLEVHTRRRLPCRLGQS